MITKDDRKKVWEKYGQTGCYCEKIIFIESVKRAQRLIPVDEELPEIGERVFKGKAIYSPKSKAGEYSKYACNFYVGCSNQCSYCYLRKGIGKATLGGDKPTLKKCFRDEAHALNVFEKELTANLTELQKHGLFFSFSTDPCLPETFDLTEYAICRCIERNVKFKVLTKCASWLPYFKEGHRYLSFLDHGAFGFTLTGHDELEPGASTNAERIEAMRQLHEMGFKPWASIEPVIDFESSKRMIELTTPFCDLYKIGLESGKKYDKKQLLDFVSWCLNPWGDSDSDCLTLYFKDGLLKAAGIRREDLPANCVTRDYNIFNDK